MSPKINEADTGEGRIRISNRERLRYQAHRRSFTAIMAGALVVLFALVLLLIMKNYTDRHIAEANNLLEKESNQYNELEKRIYERENFRSIYDLFSANLVGVANSQGAFLDNDLSALSTGVLYGVRGYVLVPAATIRNRNHVYVRIMTGDVEFIHDGYAVGVDEVSGLGLVDVPSINREVPVNLTPNQPFLAQTVLLVGQPKGDPDTGNLTMGEIHSAADVYSLATDNGEVKLSAFMTSAPIYRGNDGGAVITMDGRLAGVASRELTERLGVAPNTAVVTAGELEKVISRIVSEEGITTVSFGARGQQVRVPQLDRPGYYILEVDPDSTAQRGGIQPTDIILSVDGQPLQPNRSLDGYLKDKRAGDSVTVTLYRLGEVLSFIMKIY